MSEEPQERTAEEEEEELMQELFGTERPISTCLATVQKWDRLTCRKVQKMGSLPAVIATEIELHLQLLERLAQLDPGDPKQQQALRRHLKRAKRPGEVRLIKEQLARGSLAVEDLTRILLDGGLTPKGVAAALDHRVSSRTVHRWSKGESGPGNKRTYAALKALVIARAPHLKRARARSAAAEAAAVAAQEQEQNQEMEPTT